MGMAMEAMEAWGAALDMEDWVLVAVAMEEVSEAMVVMVVMVAMVAMVVSRSLINSTWHWPGLHTWHPRKWQMVISSRQL